MEKPGATKQVETPSRKRPATKEEESEERPRKVKKEKPDLEASGSSRGRVEVDFGFPDFQASIEDEALALRDVD